MPPKPCFNPTYLSAANVGLIPSLLPTLHEGARGQAPGGHPLFRGWPLRGQSQQAGLVHGDLAVHPGHPGGENQRIVYLFGMKHLMAKTSPGPNRILMSFELVKLSNEIQISS